MGRRQKGKGPKRKRSWHRRGGGPDAAWRAAAARLDAARLRMNDAADRKTTEER